MTEPTRTTLERERDAALAQLAALARDHDAMVAASESSNADDEHDPEGATIGFERAQLAATVELIRVRLADAEQALARLSAGGYGRCERCSAPIGAERLTARPSARACIACAE